MSDIITSTSMNNSPYRKTSRCWLARKKVPGLPIPRCKDSTPSIPQCS